MSSQTLKALLIFGASFCATAAILNFATGQYGIGVLMILLIAVNIINYNQVKEFP